MSEKSSTAPMANVRRLAAIVFTDVLGYSARMQRDETGTLELVRADFARLRELCAHHDGEVLNTMGDGMLLCFSSAVEAVNCALEAQAEFNRRREQDPAGNALEHRMGIHLGDVFREGGQVVGDGVNIAARLQTKARPGTVCLSQSVYDAVKGKVPMTVEPLGPQPFKNIAEPVSVFLVVPAGTVMPFAPRPARAKSRRWQLVGGGALVLVAMLAVLFLRKLVPAGAEPKAAASSAAVGVPLTPPEKSVAVLPLTNMSEDKTASAFFVDGIHEDILTDLALIAELQVVSRTSVMQYRDTKKSVREIGRELGVAYVLEGSVRRAGNKARVTGQLIDARTDRHVWAKAYDKDLTDIFAIQAELAAEIAGALRAVITPPQKETLVRRHARVPAAYEFFLRARNLGGMARLNAEQAERAVAWLQSAVELDPEFAIAWGELAVAHSEQYFYGNDHAPERLAKARAAIDTAQRLGPDDPEVIRAVGAYYYRALRDYPRAVEQMRRVIALQPNDSEAHSLLGLLLRRIGKWSEAREMLRRAVELDPTNLQLRTSYGLMLEKARRYPELIEQLNILCQLNPDKELNYFAYILSQISFKERGSAREADAWLAGQSAAAKRRPEFPGLVLEWADLRGDWPEAIRLIHQLRQGKKPDEYTWDDDFQFARLLAAQGETTEARRLLEKYPEALQGRLLHEPLNTNLFSQLALTEALLGHREEALRAAGRFFELLPMSGDDLDVSEYHWIMGFVHAWTGDKEAALAEYAALLKRPTKASMSVHRMRHGADYAPLVDDPRFQALLADPANNAQLF